MKKLLLAAWFASLAFAAEPFFFIQISDPQFGMYTGDRGFAQESANLEFAIAAANRLGPAFVVATGDLVNRPGDAAYIAEYRRIAAKLRPGIPLYNVPGNHDLGAEPTPASLAEWRRNFGPDFYTFRVADTAFFVLNSCLMAAPGKVEDEAERQARWLAGELAKAREGGARHSIVFQHHPFFIRQPDEKDEYFNIPTAIRRKYLDVLGRGGVTHVFAGHYHRNAAARDGGLEVVTTGPVGKPLGEGSRSGFRVVIVRESGVTHRFYDFGELPDHIGIP